MSFSELQLTRSPGGTVTAMDSYWLRLEQVIVQDNATIGEVAALIDELYEVNPCEPEVSKVEQETKDPPTLEEFQQIVQQKFSLNVCRQDASGNWSGQVKVVKSHPVEPHALNITNGVVGREVKVEEQIDDNIGVEGQSGMRLDYPVIEKSGSKDSVQFVWNGLVDGPDGLQQGPPIIRAGSTLAWGVPVSGSLHTVYPTEYLLFDFTVFGNPATPDKLGQSQLIAFYHELSTAITLDPPEKKGDDLDRVDFCLPGGAVHSGSTETLDEPDLPEWVTERIQYYCQCSNEFAYTEYRNEVTAQDVAAGGYLFPGIVKDIHGGWVDCGETTQDIATPEFYKEKCCGFPGEVDPPVTLPRCATMYRMNPGGQTLDAKTLAAYQARYGDKLKIVQVLPSTGDCGYLKISQKIKSKHCCDEVTPLVMDKESTPDVLPTNSFIIVYASGGKSPYTFTTTANNTFFASGRKTVVSTHPFVDLHSNADFCGATSVTVSDGCSSASLLIRSSDGVWKSVDDGCIFPDAVGEYMSVFAGGSTISGYVYIAGNRMQFEQFATLNSAYNPPYYNGGVVSVAGAGSACPANSSAVCADIPDNDQAIKQFHCDCAKAVGAGPGVERTTCLSVESMGGDPYNCGNGDISYSLGNIAISCVVNGVGHYGAVAAFYLKWAQTSSIGNYIWTCI